MPSELSTKEVSPKSLVKFAAENVVLDYCHLYDVPGSAVRFFNVYGPNQNPNSPYSGVISILVDRYKKQIVGEATSFTLFGDGYGIYKPVAIDLLHQALLLVANEEAALGKQFYVGTGKATTLLELIHAINEILGVELTLEYKEERSGDIHDSLADITKIQSIGYQLLLLGDRGEMLAAAIACLYLGIKTAHIHGGEVSGTVDESIRHAITKIASVHFAATEKSKERLIKMGKDSWRVFPVGAPRIDTILNNRLPSFRDIKEKYHLKFEKKKYVLQVFHPVVTELENIEKQILALINSMEQQSQPIICILPNSDAGSEIIRKMYQND
ncbi:hypothetical protein EfmAA242_10130 [Enterococcus faecium]|nr:hypothetical protein EfmAA242_10130 [Enterococcus faecium]